MKANENIQLEWPESLALIYLVAPLLIFFAAFVRIEIAILSCTYIAWQLYAIVRQTSWYGFISFRKEHFIYLAFATLWVLLSGGTGDVHQNSDWIKHYSVINFLTQHPWPATANIEGIGESVIRYAIGWYLAPSLALKLTDNQAQNLALTAWSVIGIFLFFSLLPDIARKGKLAIITPLVFIVFGGADIIGTLFTNYKHGPIYHLEWWASWIEYPSNTTSIFWVPQHAIPAWISVAYLLRAREKYALSRFIFLLGAAVFLWSPFSALGITPFMLLLISKNGFRKTALEWQSVLSTCLLGIPLCLYMTTSLENIPSGPISSIPCLWDDGDCFTWSSYFIFIVLEVGLFIITLLLAKIREKDFLIIAAISLLLIPLYRMGINNDFAMRASLPALAVLAILTGRALTIGSRKISLAILFLLFFALPTTLGEVYRGFLPGGISPETKFADPWARKYLRQYFAPLPIWVIRK